MARTIQPPINPLSPEHHDVIVQTLRAKEHLPQSFDVAESCGVNCSEMREAHAQAVAALQHILKTYFPKGRNSGPADAS